MKKKRKNSTIQKGWPKQLLVFILFVTSCVQHSQKNESEKQKVHPVAFSAAQSSDTSSTNSPPIVSSSKCRDALDTVNDSNLNQLLIHLKKSIQTRDTALLFSIMDSSVVTSYGGLESGFQDFIFNWENRDVWSKLSLVVNLGGNYSNDTTFRFPFFTIESNCQEAHKWIPSEGYQDPYTTYYSIADTAIMYSDTTYTSQIEAKLVGAFLTQPPNTYNNLLESEFLELISQDKKHRGFVARKDLFRTGDYNLIIHQDSSHNWRITAFAPYE